MDARTHHFVTMCKRHEFRKATIDDHSSTLNKEYYCDTKHVPHTECSPWYNVTPSVNYTFVGPLESSWLVSPRTVERLSDYSIVSFNPKIILYCLLQGNWVRPKQPRRELLQKRTIFQGMFTLDLGINELSLAASEGWSSTRDWSELGGLSLQRSPASLSFTETALAVAGRTVHGNVQGSWCTWPWAWQPSQYRQIPPATLVKHLLVIVCALVPETMRGRRGRTYMDVPACRAWPNCPTLHFCQNPDQCAQSRTRLLYHNKSQLDC